MRAFSLAVCLAFFSPFCMAEGDDFEWLEKSRQIIEEAKKQPAPEWLNATPPPEIMEEAERLFGDAARKARQMDKSLPSWINNLPVYQGADPVELVAQPAPEAAERSAEPPVSAAVAAPKGLGNATSLEDLLKRVQAVYDREVAGEKSGGEKLYDYKDKTKKRMFIMVSLSMPRGELQAAAMEAQENNIPLLFRGVREGQSIGKYIKEIARAMEGKVKPAPKMAIDPRPFRDSETEVVPTIAIFEKDRVLTARGTLSSSFVKKRYEGGANGDLGKFGPTYPISETPMFGDVKERADKVDWASMKDGAVQRFADRLKFVSLPRRAETRERLFDPSIVLSQDIKIPDGTMIAPSGTIVNPLKHVSLSKTVIIFNGTDPQQIEYVKAEINAPRNKDRGMILITTEFDRKAGELKGLDNIMKSLKRTVFLLQEDFARRFALQTVPAKIVQEGLNLKITEVALHTAERK